IHACRAVAGTGHVVEDDDVWTVQRRLAREEGIFCEPAGAVALTAALRAAAQNEIAPNATLICLITGSGFKDDTSLNRMLANTTCPLITPVDIATQIHR